MKWTKRIAIALAAVLLLVLLLNVGLNWWISSRLPHIINRENDSPYQIAYKDVDVSLFTRNLTATEIIVVPKSSLDSKKGKAGLYAKIESLEVNGFSIWQILFSSRIEANNLVINKPEVTLLKSNERAIDNPKSIGSEVVKPFSKVIVVNDVFLNHGAIKITGLKDNKRILDVANINIKLEGIAITDQTLAQKLPFGFKTYSIDCDSIYYRSGAVYDMQLAKIKTTNIGLAFEKFSMKPRVSRKAFVKSLATEKDLYDITAKKVSLNRIDWGFKNDAFFFKSGNLTVNNADANIYRNKMPDDDLTWKKLYNRLLRDLKVEMKIDTLLLKDSRLVYEEEKDFEKGSGKLTFNKFNMAVTGIASGYKQSKMPDVNINVQCLFMNSAKLEVDWKFNVLDKSDGFNIRGRILNFPAERMIPFTKPYMNAEVKGDLDEVYFNFTGNDKNATGDFAINYDDLKVKIYRKNDRKKQNKVLTAIANLFVKKDSKDKVTTAEVELERIREKSFFNFLWRSLAEGLKKILI